MSRQVHEIGRRRAWVIWIVALAVYVLAVFHRSSLGVAGLIAADRFGVTATQLAFFTVLQLLVYAGLQIPVGVLLDRYGSRSLLLVGLALMTAGQLLFAFATSFPLAVVARAVLGAGDAMVFVSVIRLVAVWFLVRQAPLVTQMTGQVGQLGAIVAAAPLSLALHNLGWTRTFAWASAVGVPLMVAVALLVKDSPYRRTEVVKIKMRVAGPVAAHRVGKPRHPARHVVALHVAVLRDGLLDAVGLPVPGPRTRVCRTTTASTLMMVMTGWVVVSGLALGALVARYPFYRSFLVLGIVFAMAACWGVVLLRSTPAPMWLLVVLVCLVATGGPASMVGFDLARSFTPVEASGRANGFVNVGGFSASLLTMGLVGVVLDLRAGSSSYDLDDFRVAMSVQYLFWGLGAFQILRYRRKAVAHLHRVHPGAVESMKRGEPFVHPGFADREGV